MDDPVEYTIHGQRGKERKRERRYTAGLALGYYEHLERNGWKNLSVVTGGESISIAELRKRAAAEWPTPKDQDNA